MYSWVMLEEKVYDLSGNIFNIWVKNVLRQGILFLLIVEIVEISIANDIYVIHSVRDRDYHYQKLHKWFWEVQHGYSEFGGGFLFGSRPTKIKSFILSYS